MNFILKFFNAIISPRSRAVVPVQVSITTKGRDCKRTIYHDDEPVSKRMYRPMVESRDCKRTIYHDDEPTSKRICYQVLPIVRSNKRHRDDNEDTPAGKWICLD